MSAELVSTTSLIALAMGVCAYMCVLHLWFSRGRLEAHGWVALWALLTLLFQAGRAYQITSDSGADAAAAARFYTALAPLQVATLVGFVRSLDEPGGSARTRAFFAANLALCFAILGTRAFISDEVYRREGLFGAVYWGVAGTRGMALLGGYILGALAWTVARIRRSTTLDPAERATLVASLALYAALGISSTLSSMRLLPLPGLAEFGPFAMAVGLSYLLVHRRRKLEHDLQRLLATRSAELAASEVRYRELIEAAPIGIIACDRNGLVTMVNRHRFEASGAPSREAMLGLDLLRHPSMVESGAAELVRVALTENRVTTGQSRYRSRWGASHELRGVVAPLHDATGAVSGAVVLLEDMTERVGLEEKLRHAHKMESIGQLAAGIAHEISTPMAFVRANLDQLRTDGLRLAKAASEAADSDFEALIDESLDGVNRTIAIVKDLREFAYAGGARREPVELRAVIDAALRAAAPRGDARIVDALGELPALRAAAPQLVQAFANLVTNALQAVGERGLVRLEGERDGHEVRVRVRDDGPGIAPEVRERLFEPFFTTKAPGVGTGLGLYICWEVVRAHAGELRVESTPGHGACFEVRLPLDGGERE